MENAKIETLTWDILEEIIWFVKKVSKARFARIL